MKNLSLSEVKEVSGGITNEAFLATVAVATFTILAVTIAGNAPRYVVGYERNYNYYDSGWYVPSYPYYSYGYYGYYDGYYF